AVVGRAVGDDGRGGGGVEDVRVGGGGTHQPGSGDARGLVADAVDIAALDGQFLDQLLFGDRADLGFVRVNCRGRGLDFDAGGDPGELELEGDVSDLHGDQND